MVEMNSLGPECQRYMRCKSIFGTCFAIGVLIELGEQVARGVRVTRYTRIVRGAHGPRNLRTHDFGRY